VGIPLSGKLFGHAVGLVIAADVIVEIGSIPKVLNERGLSSLENIAVTLQRGAVAQFVRDLRGSAQCGQIQAAAIGAFAARDPVVVGLVGETTVLNQTIAVGV